MHVILDVCMLYVFAIRHRPRNMNVRLDIHSSKVGRGVCGFGWVGVVAAKAFHHDDESGE
jgi:hypothetical protein